MRFCPLCAQHFPNFFPLARSYFEDAHRLGVDSSMDDAETLNLGQYSCPVCHASDRDRLYALYVQHLLTATAGARPLRVLEIAPARSLSRFLQALPGVAYRSADLYSDLAQDKVDITDMHIYGDAAFDFIVCSHVLEHVRDDRAAMRELFRVLAPGGQAILMVPILKTQLLTDEDPDEADPLQRIRRFGQDDHVRRYAREDYLARLRSCGFDMALLGLDAFVSRSGEADIFRRHGIAEGSVLYVGHKRAGEVGDVTAALTAAEQPAAGQSSVQVLPLVTVAIPAYKSTYFEAALRSAIEQHFDGFEILVCDDSPGGEIAEIVRRHQRPGLALRHLRNAQPLKERGNVRRCIDEARGRYIKLLYDDDVLAPDCLRRFVDVLHSRPDVVLVSSRRDVIGADGAAIPPTLAHVFPFADDTCLDGREVASFLADQTVNFIGEPSTVMFRRDDVLAWGEADVYALDGEPIRWVADLALYVKLLQHGHLAMLARPLSCFRVSPEQVSQVARDTPEIGNEGHRLFQRKIRELGWYIGNQTFGARPLDSMGEFQQFDLLAFWRARLAPAEAAQAAPANAQGYDGWARHMQQQRRRPSDIQPRLHLSVRVVEAQGGEGAHLVTQASLAAQWRAADQVCSGQDGEVGGPENAGAWTLYLCAGDELAPQALYEVERALLAQDMDKTHFLYCDHDERALDARWCHPALKPAANPDLLLSSPYIGRMFVVRNDWRAHVAARAAPLALPVLAYRLALAALREQGPAGLCHVPQVLCHLDPAVLPVAVTDSNTWQALAAELEAHLREAEPGSQVLEGPAPGTFHVVPPLGRTPMVSIVIPTRDQVHFLSRCVESVLSKTDYPSFEVIVVDNDSQTSEAQAFLDGLQALGSDQIRVLRAPGPFNFSRMNNRAVAQARGELVLLLNNDTAALQPDWLQHMVRQALRPGVGIVGARLLYPDGKLQHAGVIMGLRGPADHPNIGLDAHEPGYMFRAQLTQDFSAVTAACLLVSRALYQQLGGLDEDTFGVSYNDVDFCLRVGQAGHRIVWTPLATLLHEGSASQRASVENLAMEKKVLRYTGEQAAMFRRWPAIIGNDPAYNPNLSLVERGYEVEINPLLCHDPRAQETTHRVVAFAADPYGCGHYRIIQPMAAMLAQGLCDGGISAELFGPNLALRSGADTLVFQRPTRDSDQELLESLLALPRVRKVYEIDDDLSRVPIKSAHHAHVPKDMRARLMRSIGLCDRLVVSTEPLAHQYRNANGDVRVVPNRLPIAMWGPTPPQRIANTEKRKPVVGWAGGVGHLGDLELIAQVVRDTADQIDWVFFGMCPDNVRPYIKAFHEGVPTLSYPQRLMALMQDWDLAVAPLEVNAFNECKSNLRLLEYGWCGVPVLCSDVTPYQGDLPVTRVKNRYKDWSSSLLELVNDTEALARLGQALQAKVAQDWVLTGGNLLSWQRAWTDA